MAMRRFLALGSRALSARMTNTFFRGAHFRDLSFHETLEKKDVIHVLFFLGWAAGMGRGWPRILLCVWSMELRLSRGEVLARAGGARVLGPLFLAGVVARRDDSAQFS